MAEPNIKGLEKRMESTLEVLGKEFSGLRTGRASTSLLEHVVVDAYGSTMPMTQVGTINVPEPRLVTVQVWDASLVKAVEKAITNAGLGLNPQADGNMVRVRIPDLSEERRKELSKVAAKYAEQARIAVRNVRRDGMEEVKKMEKEKQISEDDQRRFSDRIQKMTDTFIDKIDKSLEQKEKEIMQV